MWHKGAQTLHDDFEQWGRGLQFNIPFPEGLSRIDFAFDFELAEIDFDEDCFVTMASKDGKAIHFLESNVRPMGRGASGVIGMDLDDEDGKNQVVGMLTTTDLLGLLVEDED